MKLPGFYILFRSESKTVFSQSVEDTYEIDKKKAIQIIVSNNCNKKKYKFLFKLGPSFAFPLSLREIPKEQRKGGRNSAFHGDQNLNVLMFIFEISVLGI